MENRKLRKSRNRLIAGVAGGIAEFTGWQANTVRLLWFFAGLFSGGTALIIYTICALVFPPPSKFDLNDFKR